MTDEPGAGHAIGFATPPLMSLVAYCTVMERRKHKRHSRKSPPTPTALPAHAQAAGSPGTALSDQRDKVARQPRVVARKQRASAATQRVIVTLPSAV